MNGSFILVDGVRTEVSKCPEFKELTKCLFDICKTFERDESVTPDDVTLLSKTLTILKPLHRDKNWAVRMSERLSKILEVIEQFPGIRKGLFSMQASVTIIGSFNNRCLLRDVSEIRKTSPHVSMVTIDKAAKQSYGCADCPLVFDCRAALNQHRKTCELLLNKRGEYLRPPIIRKH